MEIPQAMQQQASHAAIKLRSMQNSRRCALRWGLRSRTCTIQEGVGVMLEDKQQNARTHTAVSAWRLRMLWQTSLDKHVVELEKLTIGKVSCDLWVQGYAEPVTSKHSMFMSNREKVHRPPCFPSLPCCMLCVHASVLRIFIAVLIHQ